jgi:hypothetical protein
VVKGREVKGGCRKLHSEKLLDLRSSLKITRVNS